MIVGDHHADLLNAYHLPPAHSAAVSRIIQNSPRGHRSAAGLPARSSACKKTENHTKVWFYLQIFMVCLSPFRDFDGVAEGMSGVRVSLLSGELRGCQRD